MKHHSIIFFILLFTTAFLASCKKDFLQREPLSEITSESFFNNENDLKLYTNSFYSYLPDSDIFSADVNSDNVETAATSDLIAGRRVVPTDAGSAGWTWSQLYNINYFLNHYQKADVSASIKNQYAGVARIFRALFYFEKVKRFGDVPWYSRTLDANNQELYKARDPRTLVIDSILADLNFAAANLPKAKSISRITSWAALALKSRVCLFEGTFRKYHDEFKLQSTANALLQEAVKASQDIMQSTQYTLYTTGKPESDYLNLFAAENANTGEFILARVYDRGLNKTHTANGTFLTATLGAPGLTKSLINTYLLKDGRPFSSLPGYNEIPYWEEVLNRDPRLSQTIRTPGYKRIGGSTTLVTDYSNALTGYQNIKFVTGTDQDGYNSNSNDLPVYRYAEVLLNYAEAKAEMGNLTQMDADLSVNLVKARAGMPKLIINAIVPDPILQRQYKNASDPLVLEIRRERRVELVMEGFRYYDLIRWKEGHLLAEPFLGQYFPGKGEYDLDNDGKKDLAVVDVKPANPVAGMQYFQLKPDRALSNGESGNLVIHPNNTKVFDESKDYLFPLASTELLLNPNLKQNPNWK